MAKSKNKQKWIIPAIIVVILITGLVVGIVFILTNKTEIRTSEIKEDLTMDTLHCSTHDIENAFFSTGKPVANNHEIKIIFHDEAPYKMSYNYEGFFNTEKEAIDANASMHADYNLYMAKYKLDPEKLYPTFVANNASVKINIYLEQSTFNSVTAKLLFLDNDEFAEFYKLGRDGIKNLYRQKDFNCNFNK